MADQDLWRKNLPDDWEGREGDEWDSEISARAVLQITAVTGACVAVAFFVCWFFILALNGVLKEAGWMTDAYVSPIAEANLRQLPPTPRLQPKPEEDMELFLAQEEFRSAHWGWTDELAETVHMPIDRAMDLALERLQSGSASFVAPAPTIEPIDGSLGAVDVDAQVLEAEAAPSAEGTVL